MTIGADIVIETALEAGIDICFANPGTTEMPLVAALDRHPAMRPVLALHENVCTGAADGFARMAGRPALTLLHLGPGLANGAANLHNARRAVSPVINLVGDHATWHRSADAPLAMDIEGLARTFSGWVGTAASLADMERLMGEAIRAAGQRRQVATFIAPHDLQAEKAELRRLPLDPPIVPRVDAARVEQARRLLAQPDAALFIGGAALFGRGLRLAGQIAAATGCSLVSPTSFNRMEVGQGVPAVQRLPYFADAAQPFLDRFKAIVGCGADRPVSFFGWPGQPSRYLEGRASVEWLCGLHDDALPFLEALADAAGPAGDKVSTAGAEPLAEPAAGALDSDGIGLVLAAALPEGSILVPTAVTTGFAFSKFAPRARAHTQLALTGGAIGMGPSLAVGAALAAPGRKVINLEADGSGAYALQALWTQAREGLDVTTVICHNRAYKILQLELERAGIAEPGAASRHLTELSRPQIDWVKVAQGLGVEAQRVDTTEGLDQGLRHGLATSGPYLIEAVF